MFPLLLRHTCPLPYSIELIEIVSDRFCDIYDELLKYPERKARYPYFHVNNDINIKNDCPNTNREKFRKYLLEELFVLVVNGNMYTHEKTKDTDTIMTLHNILLLGGDINMRHTLIDNIIQKDRKTLPSIFNETSLSNTFEDNPDIYGDGNGEIDVINERQLSRNLHLLELFELEFALSGTFQPNSELGNDFSDMWLYDYRLWKGVKSFLGEDMDVYLDVSESSEE
jgi:hypothetical protein